MNWIVPSARPYFTEEDIATILGEVREVIESGRLVAGKNVALFEEEFARAVGTQYAVGVSSATSALEIIYRYYNVAGGEVIVPTNTFVATANAALFAGAEVVFADVEPESLCSGVADVAKRFTPKTRAVVVVHMAGLIAPEMNQLRELCAQRGVPLIEDAAHAHGAALNGKMAGNLADAAAFSFFATKVMATGDGGMITTNDAKLNEFARCIRSHGLAGPNRESVMQGYNWRMHEIAAVLGRAQLRRLPEFIETRNALAARYRALLADLADVKPISVPEGSVHSYYKYLVRLAPRVKRESLRAGMLARGIEAVLLYYPAVHPQQFYRERYGELDLPGAAVLEQTLALPMFSGMKASDVDEVVNALKLELPAAYA